MDRFDGAILDVDGTVLRGPDAIPGAVEAVQALRDAGLSLAFFSNNPTKFPAAYADRLTAAGVEASTAEVLTSGTVTAEYLSRNHAGERFFVIGEPGLCDQLRDLDLELTGDYTEADTVVASIDREFTYEDLKTALWALSDDAVGFVGTDPDRVVPAADHLIPGSGAIINAVADVAGRDPEAVLGKPHDAAREAVLARLGVPPERCLVVGDRLDTDIALGEGAGMTTVLVLSGVTSRAEVEESEHDPDFVVDSLADVPDLF
ncbi:HAD-IIA family hydrolase [Haloarchaeobius amylolyticus]|uniref:HAD-IIA family hydrolase n=1 Tax=Haloarchaeobius amylolyticus TaxID=1198296 RepID=UPI00226E3638|nr:HAD-IIA family hydrolase [Haloarchaeobius amylolyticus]